MWRRPDEFYVEGAAADADGGFRRQCDVFAGGIEADDIRQGMLSDCWLMCALSALAEFPHLVTKLFAPESRRASAAGVYRLRLCKNGMWQSVLVDDLVPCFPGGGPAYSRAHGPELWVMLVEKAYAKLHGCYAAIKMGWAYEAMIDLTGCPYLTVRVDDPDVQDDHRSGALWARLRGWDEHGYIMSCSTPGEDVYTESGRKPGRFDLGLVAGHAYTLIAAKETSRGDQLVQLRNPWGNYEWTGDWADDSDKWTPELLDELGVTLNDDDGTFWMAFDDVMGHFFSINVVITHPGGPGGGGGRAAGHHGARRRRRPRTLRAAEAPSVPPSLDGPTQWVEKRRKVTFSYGGGEQISTPLYVLSVARTTRAFVSVHQEDERCRNAKPYIDVGVTVLRIEPGECNYALVDASGNSVERQNQLEVELTPGRYLIVPTTTGCKFAAQCASAAAAGGSAAPPFPPADAKAAPASPGGRRAARRGGAREDELVMKAVRSKEFSAEVRHAPTSSSSGSTRTSTACSRATSSTRPWGDRGPALRRRRLPVAHDVRRERAPARAHALAAQCTCTCTRRRPRPRDDLARPRACTTRARLLYARTVVSRPRGPRVRAASQPHDAEAFEEAMELPIKLGKRTEIEGGRVVLYTRRSGYSGVSFAVENADPARRTLDFTLDCSLSTNVMSHRRSLVHSQLVPPGETKVLHHLMPEKSFEHWSWSIQWGAGWLSAEDAAAAAGDA